MGNQAVVACNDTIAMMKRTKAPAPYDRNLSGEAAAEDIRVNNPDYVRDIRDAFALAVENSDGQKGRGTQLGNTNATYGGMLDLPSARGGHSSSISRGGYSASDRGGHTSSHSTRHVYEDTYEQPSSSRGQSSRGQSSRGQSSRGYSSRGYSRDEYD
jgi:hypothetical protein